MGVFGLGIQVFGNICRDLVEGLRGFKNPGSSFINRMEVQTCFVVETKIVFFLFPERLEKIFFQKSSHLVIQGVGGLGQENRLPPVFVSHPVQGYSLELGGV
jgi:hypothetical protein